MRQDTGEQQRARAANDQALRVLDEDDLVFDYEREALRALRRSWTLEDRACIGFAIQDAQVQATLELAQATTNLRVSIANATLGIVLAILFVGAMLAVVIGLAS